MAHCWGGCTKVVKPRAQSGQRFSAVGRQTVILRSGDLELAVLRVTTTLTPILPLLIPSFPGDLCPLGPGDDPMTAEVSGSNNFPSRSDSMLAGVSAVFRAIFQFQIGLGIH
jgi:hypothetical protein